ncbi:tellurite resistance protein [Frankia sp. EI5c]|uniref:tellurite resistance TerB family protein n=1 Tax=Frankia sp. EI5c TaxID=683316 RepID=UPI0007C2F3EA|nr:tellurite resistance TerB family protein [Frankia sp. EI5c]OAA26026.1 tellurite resistance protein [Frankia sp. EI5c]
MSVPTSAVVDVALLVELDGGLVVRASDDGALRFPGGFPLPGESALAAAGRLLRATLPEQPDPNQPRSNQRPPGPASRQGSGSRLRFAGCVERAEPAPAGGPGRPGNQVRGNRSGSREVLTVLYAVTLDEASYPGENDLPRGLLLLRPHEVESGASLADVQPAAVSRAAVAWWADRWPSWHGRAVTDAEPWWTALRQSVRALRAQLAARRDDLHSEGFRDAAVAICALVAVADGRVDPEERDAMVESIHGEAVLADYPRADLERLFDEHVHRLRTDLAAGRRAALREVGKVRGDATRSWAILRFGAVVGRADGFYDPDERRVVREAAEVLGLSSGALAVQAVDE